MTYLMPYDLLTPKQQAALDQAAAHEAATTRDAVMFWLLNSGVQPSARRAMAARMLTSSVYVQAVCLGLVSCAHCGDQGCDWCQPIDFTRESHYDA